MSVSVEHRTSRRRGVLALLCLLAAASAAQGQNAPRIGYVYPAGGRQGTTCEITVGGQFLDGVSAVHFSGPGVTGKVLEHIKPLSQQQVNQLRDKLKELQEKPRDAATVKEIADIRVKLANYARRPMSPVLAETVRLEITLAPDAAPGQPTNHPPGLMVGQRDLRLGTPNGLTNPRVFCVDQLPEWSLRSAALPITTPVAPRDLRPGLAPSPAAPVETKITLPAVANGQIMPGGVNRYRFQCAKGLRLVAAARARELIPYLPDAVPGWFQAAITLYDAKGRELGYADHFGFHPDPVLYCEIPEDGEYVLEIRDSIYRGREDFVYRIAIGELPFVTGIYPLGGKAGARTSVEVMGWNLPAAAAEFDAAGKASGVYPLTVTSGKVISNEARFAVDALPECAEKEPNDAPDRAQALALPLIVTGRIDKPGDADVFRIEGRAGDEIVAEVTARRLGSPLDAALKLTDAGGRTIAANDDCEDKGSGLDTHHADSYLCVKLPSAGQYFLHVGDVQRQGGPEFAYRLRVSPPMPDFALRVAPASITLRTAASVPVTIHALRKDGFAGEIVLSLKNPPAGFTLSGGRVPAGQNQVRVTLSALPPRQGGATAPAGSPVHLSFEGAARIGGATVVRPAVPAEDMMQAFAYRHLVPAQELDAVVSQRGGGGGSGARATVRVLSPSPVRIPLGGTARVHVGLPTSMPLGQLQVELDDPPEGIGIARSGPAIIGTEIVLEADAAKAKPGMKGNLIATIYMIPNPPTSIPAGAPPPALRRRAVGVLPAIAFEVVGADRTPTSAPSGAR